jgi:hypothetical protein
MFLVGPRRVRFGKADNAVIGHDGSEREIKRFFWLALPLCIPPPRKPYSQWGE